MIEKYVIQDTKQNKWLLIDRVVDGMDVVTTVEYVSSFRAASIFNKESTAQKILDNIKEEGNYNVDDCIIDSVEVYFKDFVESGLDGLKQALAQVEDKDGNHLTEEQINDELEKAKQTALESIEKQFK